MGRASILNAPITLADLIVAGMAAVVVWKYLQPYEAPGLVDAGRRAGLLPGELGLAHALTGQRSEPAEMSAERVRELVEQDGRAAHEADRVDRAARRPVPST